MHVVFICLFCLWLIYLFYLIHFKCRRVIYKTTDTIYDLNHDTCTRVILGLRPANERRRYKVTPSLIGRANLESALCDACI